MQRIPRGCCSSYLDKLLEVGHLICFLLDEGSPVELAAAEPDVGLHVGQLGCQDVPDHLYRHLLPRHLLPHTQGPEQEQGTGLDKEPLLSYGTKGWVLVHYGNPEKDKDISHKIYCKDKITQAAPSGSSFPSPGNPAAAWL